MYRMLIVSHHINTFCGVLFIAGNNALGLLSVKKIDNELWPD